MKKQLRKPENWQDFETLCKRLWGEHWRCREIQKNGRSGQNQSGVDIYGRPQGEEGWYGIQCKGKDEYTHAKLTKKKILEEIEKAKKFKPALKKFYFATTANKDVDTEEIIRGIDEEHRQQGLFEVYLFSWEDIVDLIDENRETHDWYVNGIGFRNQHDAVVTFGDGSDRLIAKPRFRRTTTRYELINSLTTYSSGLEALMALEPGLGVIATSLYTYAKPGLISDAFQARYDYSQCGFELAVENIGSVALENVEIHFSIEGSFKGVGRYSKGDFYDLASVPFYDVYVRDEAPWKGRFTPSEGPIVQKKRIVSDALYIEAEPEPSEVIIRWELIARDYSTSGTLIVEIHPEFEEELKTVWISHSDKVREEITIEPIVEIG